MRALFAIIRKEFQLLLRDKPGLIILFIMPIFLVIVITLLNANDPSKLNKLSLIMMNADQGKAADEIVKHLKESDAFTIKDISQDKRYTFKQAKQEVMSGKYQILIVIPHGMSHSIKQYAAWTLNPREAKPKQYQLNVIVDPQLPLSLKNSIATSFKLLAQQIQTSTLKEISAKLDPDAKKKLDHKVLLTNTTYASDINEGLKPNATQQNVPAWAIFGMFLIIIPIASVMIKERDQGVLQRFYVAPVPRLSFLMARVIAFILVNLIQLTLMLAIGVFIFPLLNLPALNLQQHILLVAVIGLFVAFAATSFGILIGTWSRTTEQATALGPTLIVVAAALGGIFIPIFMMPENMRAFTGYSPLFWAHNAFIDILVRDADFKQILPSCIKLFIFSIVILSFATLRYMRKG